MIEIARVFGNIKREQSMPYSSRDHIFFLIALILTADWRPRRTIVFCSWGAHEYGLVGSYEWTQQHAKVLGQRAVAYLNVDTAVSGKRGYLKSKQNCFTLICLITQVTALSLATLSPL